MSDSGYDTEFLVRHNALIEGFLINADKNILDISYAVEGKQIRIQVVLIYGSTLPQDRIDLVNKKLSGYKVSIEEVYLTKEQFNENVGDWLPKYYKWLENLLFVKAEEL